MRRIITRSLQASLLLAGAATLFLAVAPADAATVPSSSAAVAAGVDKHPVQLADEIIRRLRRLGLNFSKNRVSHPYDPFFEVC